MITYVYKAGSTDVSVVVRIVDGTTGLPETGVAYDNANLTMYTRREGAATATSAETSLAALTTSHTDYGFKEIGAGYYRYDLPDSAVASGAKGVLVYGTLTNKVIIGCYIQLIGSDPFTDSTYEESVLSASAKTMSQGTVNATGNTTTQITLSTITTSGGSNSVGANALAGRRVFFQTDTTTSGLRGCGARITANTATSGTTVLTLDSNDTLPATPASGDTLVIA